MCDGDWSLALVFPRVCFDLFYGSKETFGDESTYEHVMHGCRRGVSVGDHCQCPNPDAMGHG